jgi:hypothetical protein
MTNPTETPVRLMATIKCHSCGKEMPLNPCEGMEDEDGLEGYIAREMPVPDRAYCSDACLKNGRPQ